MAHAISILLIDDNTDPSFIEPLADKASNRLNADLHHVPTWEQALARLEAAPYEFQGLILDGKGQKSTTSKAEDGNFIKVVLEQLKARARDGFFIPYVIYTGFADELTGFFEDEPIYWKGRVEEDLMFEKLQEQINNTDVHKCRMLYPEFFSMFQDGRLDRRYETDLARTMSIQENKTASGTGEDVARSLRLLIENSFRTLHNLDPHMIAARFIDSAHPNVSGIIFHLAGSPKFNKDARQEEYASDPVLPTHIRYLLECLHKITSGTAMHHNEGKASPYLLKAITAGTLEYLVWFKSFTDKNFPS